VVNVCSKVLPVVVNALGGVKPESKSFPLFGSLVSLPDVTVCSALSLFVHFTVSPTLTLISFGSNPLVGLVDAPLGIDTSTVAAKAGRALYGPKIVAPLLWLLGLQARFCCHSYCSSLMPALDNQYLLLT
jgi:hypothetical protein